MNLRRILLAGSLALTLGACSVFSSSNVEEKEISKEVIIYRHNLPRASIKGPFVVKKEKGYASFAEVSENEEIKFKPVLYQLENKNVYLDCQRDGFSGNEESINFLIGSRVITPENLYTPNQICKIIGY